MKLREEEAVPVARMGRDHFGELEKNRGRRGTFSDPERPPEGATGGKSTPLMECYPEPTGIPGRPSGQMQETFVRREEKRTGYEFIRSLPDTEITAWTDGSVCNKSGGAGAVVYSAQGCKELREGVGILCSSYRTEMWAIAVALRERAAHHPGKSITIFTDSLSAVEGLRRGPTKQDCETGREIWNLLVDGAQNRIVWVPAHCGLDGNGRADQVANSAVNAGSGRAQILLQSAIAAIKCQARQDTATFIGEARCLSKVKKLDNRRDQVIWNQCMSGYSTVDGATLARFDHERAPNCEHCGNTETSDHIMTACPRGDAIRWAIAGRNFSRQTLIDNPRQLKRLLIGVGKNPY